MSKQITEEKFNLDSLAEFTAVIIDIAEQLAYGRDGPDTS